MHNQWIRRITASLVLLWVFAVPLPLLAAEEKPPLDEIVKLLEQYHVSGLGQEALQGDDLDDILERLDDPHTQYFSDEELGDFQDAIEQNYVGIGVRIDENADGIVVVEAFKDSPAAKAGILPGDYFHSVDGQAVKDMTMETMVGKIKGPADTEVRITMRRGEAFMPYTLVRAPIDLPTVTLRWFSDNTAYIDLSSFSLDAGHQFDLAMEDVRTKPAEGLILDLRNNPGGYLSAARRIAAEFVQNGVLMYTKNRERVTESIDIAQGESVPFPVTVLINGGSASASEILSGALQDMDLAVVVGTQSYGKGSVQRIYPVSGGAVKITVEEYLTPGLHKVDGVGITPDVIVSNPAGQVFAAFHELDTPSILVESGKEGMVVNGLSFAYPLDARQHEGELYIHSRLAAAFIGLEIDWNGSERTVVLGRGSERQIYPADSADLLWMENKVYLKAGTLQKQFATFRHEVRPNGIELSFTKEQAHIHGKDTNSG